MTENERRECTPQQYLLKLFSETKNGSLEINYFPYNHMPEYSITYKMDWTEQDAKNLADRYTTLIASLDRIAKLYNQLTDSQTAKSLLSSEDFEVWNTYVRPFTPFEVDESVIDELYFRAEYDQLEDDENDLLERHYEWYKANCLERLPYVKCAPNHLISHVRRYVSLSILGAPEVVITAQGKYVVEEMVQYYHAVENPYMNKN